MDSQKSGDDSNTFQPICKNTKQAKAGLAIIYGEFTSLHINGQFFDWINMHPQGKKIHKFQEEFSDLELDFDWYELLDPARKIPKWPKYFNTAEATALTVSMVIVDLCWDLFGQKIYLKNKKQWDFDKSSNEYATIKKLIKDINIKILLKALYSSLINTVGSDLIKAYQTKLLGIGDNPHDIKKAMDEFQEMKDKIDLIIFFSAMRALLDCCYCLFKKQ